MTLAQIKKSDLIEQTLRFQGKPLSFRNYPLSRQIIDTEADFYLLKGGRQIAKSVTLANVILSDIMAYPYNSFLYIAPTLPQVKVFSADRIAARIEESPDFKDIYLDKTMSSVPFEQNIFKKTFANGSQIYFRSETQLDSIRGIAVKQNMFDEIQDIPSDSIPIIIETMSGQEDENDPFLARAGTIWYAGTPKSINNPIEQIWQSSRQIVPVIVCDAGHHNIPNLEMIQPEGLLCTKCKSRVNVREAYFKAMGNKDSDTAGFWLPQVVFPIHTESEKKWRVLYKKKMNYPKEKFLNEVMGISAGEGIYLINEQQLQHCCIDHRDGSSFEPWDGYMTPLSHGISEMWCGIDWGVTAKTGYTVILVGGFDTHTNRFRIVYGKKFLDPDAVRANEEIAEIIKRFGVQYVCADNGAGHFANRDLEMRLGMPVLRVSYAGDRLKMQWDGVAGMYKASRTRTLIDSFTNIRHGRVWFYDWKKFKDLAPHFLAEYHEETFDNRGNVVLKFDHPDSKPDDALHAFNVMFSVFKETRDPKGFIFG